MPASHHSSFTHTRTRFGRSQSFFCFARSLLISSPPRKAVPENFVVYPRFGIVFFYVVAGVGNVPKEVKRPRLSLSRELLIGVGCEWPLLLQLRQSG